MASSVNLSSKNVGILLDDICRLNGGFFDVSLMREFFGLVYLGYFRNEYTFDIVSEEKWFLAKIKFGI